VRQHINLAEPEPRHEIVRGQFPDARERDGGLAEVSILRRHDYAFRKAKTGFVERSVGVDHFIPIVIFAKLITGGFGWIHRHALAGTETLIKLEIDLRDDVVGVELFRQGESSGGFFQFMGALQLHAQKSRLRE